MANLLVAGRRLEDIAELAKRLEMLTGAETQSKLLVNGNVDPLGGIDDLPSALVLLLEESSTAELEALINRPNSRRAPLIVIGAQGDPATLRLAMKAGARDFMDFDTDEAQLKGVIEMILREKDSQGLLNDCEKVAVVNASGGSGATTIAVNIAYDFAKSGLETVLVDLDRQYSPISQYLDIEPKRGILEALERIHELDMHAILGYLTTHESGTKLLSALPSAELIDWTAYRGSFDTLIDLVGLSSSRIVFDLPTNMDGFALDTIERADHIVVVLQQNIVSLRNATRLFEIFRRQLAIPDGRVMVAINRFQKNSIIELADIKRTLNTDQVCTIPNNFDVVSESINTGVPLMRDLSKTALGRAIRDLEAQVGGLPPAQSNNIFKKTLLNILRT